jgi:predicted RND superfamily exporter protein
MVSKGMSSLFERGIDNLPMGGYLICENCGGYYQLQDGESPYDFDFCECGGSLNYQKDIEIVSRTSDYLEDGESSNNEMDYKEIHETIINLKNKAERRKKEFEELSKKVEIQEELIKEIKEGKWNITESETPISMQAELNQQKAELQNISGNQDIYPLDEKSIMEAMNKKNKLINQIQSKRSEVRNSESSTPMFKNILKSDQNSPALKVRLLGLAVIAIILILLIAFFFI